MFLFFFILFCFFYFILFLCILFLCAKTSHLTVFEFLHNFNIHVLVISFFKCGDPFQEDALVMLNGSKEEVEKLQKAMEERRLKAKTAKVN